MLIYKPSISLLIICLVVILTIESGDLNFPTINVKLFISPFISVDVSLIYIGALLFGGHIFITVISFCELILFSIYIVLLVSFYLFFQECVV